MAFLPRPERPKLADGEVPQRPIWTDLETRQFISKLEVGDEFYFEYLPEGDDSSTGDSDTSSNSSSSSSSEGSEIDEEKVRDCYAVVMSRHPGEPPVGNNSNSGGGGGGVPFGDEMSVVRCPSPFCTGGPECRLRQPVVGAAAGDFSIDLGFDSGSAAAGSNAGGGFTEQQQVIEVRPREERRNITVCRRKWRRQYYRLDGGLQRRRPLYRPAVPDADLGYDYTTELVVVSKVTTFPPRRGRVLQMKHAAMRLMELVRPEQVLVSERTGRQISRQYSMGDFCLYEAAEHPLTGNITNPDILCYIFEFLFPVMSTLLAASRVSRAWKFYSNVAPQWHFLTMGRFPTRQAYVDALPWLMLRASPGWHTSLCGCMRHPASCVEVALCCPCYCGYYVVDMGGRPTMMQDLERPKNGCLLCWTTIFMTLAVIFFPIGFYTGVLAISCGAFMQRMALVSDARFGAKASLAEWACCQPCLLCRIQRESMLRGYRPFTCTDYICGQPQRHLLRGDHSQRSSLTYAEVEALPHRRDIPIMQ